MIPFLTFIFVMVVTAVLFGSWVVAMVARVIWRALIGGPRQMQPSGPGRQCLNPTCRSANPLHAQFCRRCGSNLTETSPQRQMSQPQPRFNPYSGAGNGAGNRPGRQMVRV
jgi:hypothetical protein